MSFFLKKKCKVTGPAASGKRSRVTESHRDEELSSDSDVDDTEPQKSEEDEYADETAYDKRRRLAKQYLQVLEQEERERTEDANLDHDAIARRLRTDELEQSGRLQKKLADHVVIPSASEVITLRGFKRPVNCVCLSPDGRFVYAGCKDGSIIKWDVASGKKLRLIKGRPIETASDKTKANTAVPPSAHHGQVLCLAVTKDGTHLCSGASDALIHVWSTSDMDHVKVLTGHRSSVTSVSIRQGFRQLFSASEDRSIKVWDLHEMGYVETLYGHQDSVLGIDCLQRERALSCGGRDRTVRMWKIVEESQLVFNSHGDCGSIDCVAMINEDHFISGSDDGALCLWSLMKKKPVCLVPRAHSLENDEPCWITAVACVRMTDLIASGARDGWIKLWRCAENYKSLDVVHRIAAPGFVNGLSFKNDGSVLAAAVSQEHRLGRWWRIKEVKNRILIANIGRKNSSEDRVAG